MSPHIPGASADRRRTASYLSTASRCINPFGALPKGLMYGLQCLDSWLYSGDPLMHLEYEETFAFLKKAAKEGVF